MRDAEHGSQLDFQVTNPKKRRMEFAVFNGKRKLAVGKFDLYNVLARLEEYQEREHRNIEKGRKKPALFEKMDIIDSDEEYFENELATLGRKSKPESIVTS